MPKLSVIVPIYGVEKYIGVLVVYSSRHLRILNIFLLTIVPSINLLGFSNDLSKSIEQVLKRKIIL